MPTRCHLLYRLPWGRSSEDNERRNSDEASVSALLMNGAAETSTSKPRSQVIIKPIWMEAVDFAMMGKRKD